MVWAKCEFDWCARDFCGCASFIRLLSVPFFILVAVRQRHGVAYESILWYMMIVWQSGMCAFNRWRGRAERLKDTGKCRTHIGVCFIQYYLKDKVSARQCFWVSGRSWLDVSFHDTGLRQNVHDGDNDNVVGDEKKMCRQQQQKCRHAI